VRLVNVNHQSVQTSAETVAVRTLTEDGSEGRVSDSSCSLGKSDKTAVVKITGSVPVVNQSTNAAAAASAAVAACVVVLKPLSCVSGQQADSHNEQVGAASRGRRRKCRAVDTDVEPDDAVLTSSSTAPCECCPSRCCVDITGFMAWFVS